MAVQAACPACGCIHDNAAVTAVGRFDPAPTMYVARFAGAPVRLTRTEAEADWCAHRANRPTATTEAVETRPHLPVTPPHDHPQPPPPFPADRMETLARERAFQRFQAEVLLSLNVWQLDRESLESCGDPREWIQKCAEELATIGGQ